MRRWRSAVRSPSSSASSTSETSSSGSPAETAGQVLSATAFGFAYAGARLHVGSIWALAVLHGLSNFFQDRLAGEVPGPMYLAVAILLGAYGLVLVRAAGRSSHALEAWRC